jgi:predicted phage terminase large subunit-like protein
MANRKEAAEELLRRQKVQSSLLEWCRLIGPAEPGLHHRAIIDRLEAVVRGDVRKLMVFTSPGAGKSWFCSVCLPAWFMARTGKSILAVSHTVELSEKWGRRIRGLLQEHGNTLGATLSDASAAAGRFSLSNGAEYLAAGSGMAVVGFRASGGVILDDPVRGAEDAASETARNKLYEFYRSDVTSRLTPGAFIVLIMTRWHCLDLAGRLLEEEGSEWEVLSLPAQAGPNCPLGRVEGEFLWDTKDYGYGDFLRDQKRTSPPRTWAALYQQNPIAESGNALKIEWLKKYHNMPDRDTMRTYLAADYATTDGAGDYTVIICFGLDPSGDIFVLDCFRKQCDTATGVDATLDMARDWDVQCIATESGQLKNAIFPWLKKRMDERKIYKPVETIPSRASKEIRATSIAGHAATKGIFLPANAPWVSDFMTEWGAFPLGRTDDMIDCCSLLGQLISRLSPGSAPIKKEPPKIISTDPNSCTVTMNDLWDAEDRRSKRGGGLSRIK